MKYSVKQEVFKLNPHLHFGILIGKGLTNSESKDVEFLRRAESFVRQSIGKKDSRCLPTIKAYRDTMEKAGINPNKYPPSIEAMLKRVLKGNQLPTINILVDLCNIVSLENMISLGGHDLKDIHEDLSVCFSNGTERFLPIGTNDYETVERGELIFTSGDVVQTRRWIWRQSELGKMTLNTKNIFFHLVGFEDLKNNKLKKALDSLEKLATKKCGGIYQNYIVNSTKPEINFTI